MQEAIEAGHQAFVSGEHKGGFNRAIEDPPVIAKILTHLGLSARAPPRSPARSFDRFQIA
jgi:hypothetical protein